MSSSVVRRFLDATSETLEVISLRGWGETSPLFVAASFSIVFLTSFTMSLHVVGLTLAVSVAVLITVRNSRKHLRRLLSAITYVFLFSLVALTPFLIDGLINLYIFYVFRAVSVATFLLATTAVSGWEGLSRFMRSLKLSNVATVLMIYVKVIAVLLRDASKILLSREARLLRGSGMRNLQAYATVIGDLLIRSSERGKRAFMAVEARTLSKISDGLSPYRTFKPSKLDILVSVVAFIEFLICFMR